MKDLREKAETGPDAVRFTDAEGSTFRVESPALYDPDSISPEGEYPEFGDWLETESGFLECPRCLAAELIEAVDMDDVAFPAVIQIENVRKVDQEFAVEASIEEAK